MKSAKLLNRLLIMTKNDSILKLAGFLMFAEEAAQELTKHDDRAKKLAKTLKSLKKDFRPILEEQAKEFDEQE